MNEEYFIIIYLVLCLILNFASSKFMVNPQVFKRRKCKKEFVVTVRPWLFRESKLLPILLLVNLLIYEYVYRFQFGAE